ncbi:hypothetical protein R1flu_011500 [Riccia fluitans]|uniref:Uncharacterized protein n=1 Tax=Riccia fluitans TaxID=41844 RepID=A0ABD1Z879_9MARC
MVKERASQDPYTARIGEREPWVLCGRGEVPQSWDPGQGHGRGAGAVGSGCDRNWNAGAMGMEHGFHGVRARCHWVGA